MPRSLGGAGQGVKWASTRRGLIRRRDPRRGLKHHCSGYDGSRFRFDIDDWFRRSAASQQACPFSRRRARWQWRKRTGCGLVRLRAHQRSPAVRAGARVRRVRNAARPAPAGSLRFTRNLVQWGVRHVVQDSPHHQNTSARIARAMPQWSWVRSSRDFRECSRGHCGRGPRVVGERRAARAGDRRGRRSARFQGRSGRAPTR